MGAVTRSLLTPLLLAVLLLSAAGCGGDEPGDASSSPSESTSSASPEEPTEPASSSAPSDEVPPSDVPSESAPVPSDEGEGDDDDDGGDDGDGGEDADDAAVVASMQTSLRALVDPKTTPQQKADRVVGGRDLAPLFRQFAGGSGDADIAFTVEEPEVEGRRATALVGATDRGQPLAAPARTPFVLADGEWRLERRTVCVFAEQVGLNCP